MKTMQAVNCSLFVIIAKSSYCFINDILIS